MGGRRLGILFSGLIWMGGAAFPFSLPAPIASNGQVVHLTVTQGALVFALRHEDKTAWVRWDADRETYGESPAVPIPAAEGPATVVSNDGRVLHWRVPGRPPVPLPRPPGMDFEGELTHALSHDGRLLSVANCSLPSAAIWIYRPATGKILTNFDPGKRGKGFALVRMQWLGETLLATFAAAGPWATSLFFDGKDGRFLGTVGGGKKPLNTCSLQVLSVGNGEWCFFAPMEGRMTFQEPARGSLLAEAPLGEGREGDLEGRAIVVRPGLAAYVCPGPGAGRVVLVDLVKRRTRLFPSP